MILVLVILVILVIVLMNEIFVVRKVLVEIFMSFVVV